MAGMRIVGWAGWLGAAALVSTVQAADLVIEAPAFAVGDTWEFEGTDNGQPYRWSRSILAIDGDGNMQVKALRNGRETIEHYDRSMNRIIDGKVDPARITARYPMKVGDRIPLGRTLSNPNAMVRGELKVLAQERVTVPAGTFECLKVETEVESGFARSQSMFTRTVRWHCPAIKWAARDDYRYGTSSAYNPAESGYRATDLVLVRFTPGK